MGLNFRLFSVPKHKVFNYQPVFYDERKEALKEKIEAAEKKQKGEYVPGESIRGAFIKPRYTVKKSSDRKGTFVRVITIITLIILMIAVVYFTQVMNLFFK